MRIVYIPKQLPIELKVHPPPIRKPNGVFQTRARPKGVRMVVYVDKIVLHKWR